MQGRPLVLLTRPADRAASLAKELEQAGADTLIWPLLDIRTSLSGDTSFPPSQAVVFTSARAVEALRRVIDAPAFCVGASTAKAARDAGFTKVFNADGDAEALAALIADALTPADGPLLYLRGRDVARDMSALLPGFEIIEIEAYHAAAQKGPPPSVAQALSESAFDVAAFFSPRTASIFAEIVAGEMGESLSEITAVAMSARVSERLNQIGFRRVIVSERPDSAAMRAAICGACGIAPPQDRVCD